jgi:hypothetical protein
MKVYWMSGGIGNQLFIYAAALKMEINSCDKVKFDLRNYKFDFRKFKLNDLGFQIDEANWLQLLPFRPKVKKIIDKLGFLNRLKSSVIYEKSDYKTSIDFNFLYYYGYWHETHNYIDVLGLIKSKINLNHKLKSSIFNFWEKKIKGCFSISLHVRRSDYLSNLNSSTYVELGLDYYNRCINKILEINSNAVFFIFSDDETWAKENLIINNQLSFFVSGSMNNDCCEFELARTCRANIIANSTFSWWIATLNKNEDSIAFAPKSYYRSSNLHHEYTSGRLLYNPKFIYIEIL